jgi:hypothetical protein
MQLSSPLVAHNTTLKQLQTWVDEDPFVATNVVTAEIIEIVRSNTDERIQHLLG